MSELVTKTLIIKSRGRQYFTCVMGGNKAKLVIDGTTEHLQVDRIVTIRAVDLSTRSNYGTELKFQAVEILDDRSAAEARERAAARKDAEKWLRYAEQDVSSGLTRTNAIHNAFNQARAYDELADRLAALRTRIDSILAAQPEKDARLWLDRAISDVESGLLHTRAVRIALADAVKFESLAERLAELRALIAEKTAAEQARPQTRRLLLVDVPPLGRAVRHYGHPMVFLRVVGTQRISGDDPSIFGSHLLGYEGERGSLVEFRDATDDEIAALTAEETKKAAVAAAAAQRATERDAIARQIMSTGQMPQTMTVLAGEMLCGGPTIYGTGQWFVIEGEYVWFVRNNGMDGDDWSRNNVRTGGAGAIGWRTPSTPELIEQLNRLHQEGTDDGW